MDQTNPVPDISTAQPSHQQIQDFLDQCNPSPDGNLIGLLQQVQDHFGYLPANALTQIARRTRTPLSRIYGVVSFYAQFYTSPRGRHTIRCCRGTACYVRGGKAVIDAIRNNLGIDDGQTTEDMMFTFETVACLGACALAPVVMVDSTYFGKATPQSIDKIIESFQDQQPKSKERQ